MLQLILSQVLPPLIDALTPMLVATIAALLFRWTGVQVEAKHMAALQSALANGAKLTLAGRSMDEAIDYVERSVPDALTRFKARDRPRIAELLAPHLAALPLSGPAAPTKGPAGK
ncbi:hypothetical protein [Mycoplana ramosa]|uniref:Uncharacterized protein n=1 Tax=Mycoplana ramosa TaxID=40837 RepID=A0ABW3Z246_MYCRA